MIASGMARQPAQQRAQIFAAAFAEVSAATSSSSAAGSVEAAASRASSRSSPGSTASAMPRSRASADSRSMPYFHQSRPPSRRTTITLAWRADAIDPQIDRHRMTQVAQMREPHARQRRALGLPGGGEARRGRCRRTTARRCRPAAGRDRPLRRSRRDWSSSSSADASFVYPHASACVTAARSSPFSPITTSRPSRASAPAQGRSY